MANTRSLTVAPSNAVVESANVVGLLEQIRGEWRARQLIKRVSMLLPVDPSSACQRLLNASFHDLREKIYIAGLDIATEAAKQHKLPTVARAEDVEHYSNMNTLNLAYHMGLLARPAWRRLLRAYDIRRDLEHEDDEYQATEADCLYVFKTCIEDVLAKDPIQVIRVDDVKEVLEQSETSTLTKVALEEFEHAPRPRQEEIWQYLTGVALDPKKPDIIRQNCYRALGSMRELVQTEVLIDVAKSFVKRIGREEPKQVEFQVAYVAGVLPYLKKLQVATFFESYAEKFKSISPHWSSYDSHGALLRGLEEIGGLKHCPSDIINGFLEWLVLCYIGEPGGYGRGVNRPVFYSDVGAPICLRLLRSTPRIDVTSIEELRKSSRSVKAACADKHVARRLEAIIDKIGE